MMGDNQPSNKLRRINDEVLQTGSPVKTPLKRPPLSSGASSSSSQKK
jgi:hypothetical protein